MKNILKEIWPSWHIVKEIGEGAVGKVYEIEKEDIGGIYHSALKVIKIPQTQKEITELMNAGMDEESVTVFFMMLSMRL